MSDVPAVSLAPIPADVSNEVDTDDFFEHLEPLEEQDLPQGVLGLIQQLLPQRPVILGPTNVKLALTNEAKKGPALQGGDTKVLSAAVQTARLPGMKLALATVAPSQPTVQAAVQTAQALVPSARLLDKSTADRMSTPPAVQSVQAPERELVAQTEQAQQPGGDSETPDKPTPTLTAAMVAERAANAAPRAQQTAQPDTPSSPQLARLLQTPKGTQKGDQPYLSLPFAKDSAVGLVNVSKPTGDAAQPLQLSSTNVEITRQLSEHLDGTQESRWRMADSQDSGQHGRDAREQPEDEAEEGGAQGRSEDRQG